MVEEEKILWGTEKKCLDATVWGGVKILASRSRERGVKIRECEKQRKVFRTTLPPQVELGGVGVLSMSEREPDG